jgi:hypothetical protein
MTALHRPNHSGLDSSKLIAKCVIALAAQSYRRLRYEVVIVENRSADSKAAVARGYCHPF